MTQNTYQISLNFEQILELVKQLPQADQLRLSKELEKSTYDRRLTELLEAFKANEIDLETINQEAETVKSEFYARQESNYST
ncbi:MAG: type II toxin-antitoxin system VapB15 family antitoxin [Waterburya sp.]